MTALLRVRERISSKHRGRRGARPARREEGEYCGVFNRRALSTLAPRLLSLAVLLSVGLWGCNWLTGPRSRDQPKQGVILEVDRHKAALYINDQAITLLDSRKPNVIGLEPGTYRVEIRKAGYFSRYFDVKVTAKEFKRIKALLPPELD